MNDLIDIGSARLDPKSNALLVQAKTTPVGADDDDAPDMGDAPVMGALGVTSFPAPANKNGHAQGIKTNIPGTIGIITALRDTRTADVTAELGPGETCLHSTGEGFESRVFCKDELVAIVVGDDMTISVDRKNKQITISCFGAHFEVSKEHGAYMTHGGAMIQAKDGMCILTGQVVLGGRNPIQPVMMGPGGPAGVSAPGVFIGACRGLARRLASWLTGIPLAEDLLVGA